MNLGKRLRDMRLRNHLTQAKLAQQINSSAVNISKYELEKTEPTLDTLKLLAAALGTTADYLIGIPGAPISARTQTSPTFSKLLETTADFSEKETAKLLEYATMLKKSRE